VTINVAKAVPIITWPDPPDIFVGTVLSTLQLNAVASVPGTFVYSRPLGTILPLGPSQNIRVDFTPTDTSNFVNATRTIQINVVEPTLDYGDAPPRYPVTLAQDGARHRVSDLFLGSNRSAEADAKPSPSADGDAGDDGIAFAATILSASVVTTSSLIVTSSGAGLLDGWIDFNNDGDWLDMGEQISVSTPVNAGRNLISFQVPAGAATGNIAARFRLSSAGNLAPTGEANDGEVEDYLIRIVAGAPSANVNVSLFDGDTRIGEVAGELVIEQETTLFRAPISRFASVVIVGTNADETLHLTHFDELTEKSIRIDGGSGDDRMVLPAAEHSVDLTAPNLTIRNIEMIDTKESGKSYLQLNLDAVKAMATSSDIVEVIAKLGDRIEFGSGWQIDAPRFIDGNFTHIIHESAAEGTAEVRLRNDRMLQNPLKKFDADRDGKILPLDALRIINALSRINRGGRPEGERAATPLETSSPANKVDMDINFVTVLATFASSDKRTKRVNHENDLTLFDVAFAATDDWGDERDNDVRKDLRNDAFGVTLLSDD
jgi:hypothetical protein